MQVLSNRPPVVVEFPADLAEFLLETSNSSIVQGLQFLQIVRTRENQKALIDQIEKFKAIKKLVEEAKK